MKNFKRVVAALLLGAMMMTLMAGCGKEITVDLTKNERVLKAIRILTDNDEIVMDNALQAKAELVANAFINGSNLESNQAYGRAYARVSPSNTEFWNIVEMAEYGSDWVGPLWFYYDYTNTEHQGVNVSLMLPYSDNVVSMAKTMMMTTDEACYGDLEYRSAVGIAIAEVEGDEYVVIVAR